MSHASNTFIFNALTEEASAKEFPKSGILVYDTANSRAHDHMKDVRIHIKRHILTRCVSPAMELLLDGMRELCPYGLAAGARELRGACTLRVIER
jgi:hypothetical protein